MDQCILIASWPSSLLSCGLVYLIVSGSPWLSVNQPLHLVALEDEGNKPDKYDLKIKTVCLVCGLLMMLTLRCSPFAFTLPYPCEHVWFSLEHECQIKFICHTVSKNVITRCHQLSFWSIKIMVVHLPKCCVLQFLTQLIFTEHKWHCVCCRFPNRWLGGRVFFSAGIALFSGVGSWCPLGVRSWLPGAGFCGTGGGPLPSVLGGSDGGMGWLLDWWLLLNQM